MYTEIPNLSYKSIYRHACRPRDFVSSPATSLLHVRALGIRVSSCSWPAGQISVGGVCTRVSGRMSAIASVSNRIAS